MGVTTPTTKADEMRMKSRLENRKNVCNNHEKMRTDSTTIICAASIPVANSNNGIILSVGFPDKIELK